MNAALHECLNSARLKSSIDKFAYRLSYRFPDTYDIDDGRQELWLEIIRKVGTANSTLHMVKLAEDSVYSKYGRTAKRHTDEVVRNHDMIECVVSDDRSIELAEARVALDQVHTHLESIGKTRLRRVFDLYRQDIPSHEIAKRIGVSSSRVRRMKQEIITIAAAM